MAEVKPEIKVDSAEETKMADIDEFEEDTDLQIPTEEAQAKGAWLVKVSEDMWKAWNDIYQHAPADGSKIEVGKLRVYHQKPGAEHEEQRIQIRLNEDFNQHKLLPRMYNLEMKATSYNNTVVFSEKDLPGHRSQPSSSSRNLATNKPSGIQNKYDRYGRRPGTYRSAIPKQTALAPTIRNEAVAKPVEDETALDFFKMQYDVALNAGKKATFNPKIYKGHRAGAASTGFTFGTTTSKPGKSKKKQPQEKAVRMPKEELLDKLQQCFQEYQYWPAKALRERLKQPETWIKEVLDDIAYPMRSGDYIGTYKLNDSSARLLKIQSEQLKSEAAPVKNESDQGTGDELGEGDDDDDVLDDFEDVKMEGT